MAFKEVNSQGTRIRFENIGESVEGRMVSAAKVEGNDGLYMKYTINDGKENKIFLGCYQLDQILPQIPVGTLIQVTYKGKENIGGGKTVKNFQVMVDDGVSAPVAS